MTTSLATYSFPPDVTAAALKVLNQLDPYVGPELDAAIEARRKDLPRIVRAYQATTPLWTPIQPAALQAFLVEILPPVLTRRHYAALRRTMPGGSGAVEESGLCEEIAAAVRDWAGPDAAGAFVALKAQIRSELETELGRLDVQLSKPMVRELARQPLGQRVGGMSEAGPHDEEPTWISLVDRRIRRVVGLLAARKELVTRLEALSASGEDAARQATADHARQAVDLAGGQSGLAARILEARTLRGLPHHEGEGADIDAMIADALEGGHEAREAIIIEARSWPAAFPDGLAAALAYDHPILEPIQAVVAEVVRKLDEHAAPKTVRID